MASAGNWQHIYITVMWRVKAGCDCSLSRNGRRTDPMEQMILIMALLSYCVLLACAGPRGDRSAWNVMSLAVAVDLSLFNLFPNGFGPDWGPFIGAMQEFFCMQALVLHAWTPMGRKLFLTVGAFWLAHLCLYLDVNRGSNLIYDQYEIVILGLEALVFAIGANGVLDIIERASDRIRAACRANGWSAGSSSANKEHAPSPARINKG